jgi:hypothetical protein
MARREKINAAAGLVRDRPLGQSVKWIRIKILALNPIGMGKRPNVALPPELESLRSHFLWR